MLRTFLLVVVGLVCGIIGATLLLADETSPSPVRAQESVLAPDLVVTKSADPVPVKQYSYLYYTITVTNIGNAPSAPTTVTDTIPDGTIAMGASGVCSLRTLGQVTCAFPPVPPFGGSLSVNFFVYVQNIVAQPDCPVNTVENRVTVAPVMDETNLANNQTYICTAVQPHIRRTPTPTGGP